MSLPFKWELPGGKCESGEQAVDCLIRETMEETGIEIQVSQSLPPVDREFKGKNYRMLPFLGHKIAGKLFPFEHEQVVWWPISRLWELDWGPAEKMLLENWVEMMEIEVESAPVLAEALA